MSNTPTVTADPTPSESTLELYGQNLPIGVLSPDGTQVGKGFAFRPLDFEVEEAIDKARNRPGGPGAHPAKVATEVLALTLTEWGGDPGFGTKAHEHKLAALQSAFVEDVLFAWVSLRVETMGEVLAVGWTCASCAHEWQWETDLGRLQITTVDAPPVPVRVKLHKPVSFGERTLVACDLLPAKWSAVYNVTAIQRRGSIGDIRNAILRSAVSAVVNDKGERSPLAPRAFQLITKRDRERLTKALDSPLLPRCDLSLEVVCPKCGHKTSTQLEWSWDFFFGSASLPAD